MNRREFLLTLPAAAAAFEAGARFRKSICSTAMPKGRKPEEFFGLARDAGFEGIELRIGPDVPTDASAAALSQLRSAADRAKVTVSSLWVSQQLGANPLNADDPAKRAAGIAAIERATQIANALGCGALLIVPGRTGSGPKFAVGYETSWKRITDELRKCIPAAEKTRVLLTVENVWSKFLVSPVEMRNFIDQFQSPWVQAHFDTGNVMQYGYPEDWIQTLGARIKRVHIKDYKLSARAEQGRFVEIAEGDVNWPDVMKGFVKAGYQGFLSPEYEDEPTEANRLLAISEKLDKLIALA